ncbi:MAG: PAS domain S-box protein [Actinomycetota bacterium]
MAQDLVAIAKNLFTGGGQMGALMRSYDWSKTPFGSVEQWPQSLRSALSICLNSQFPIAIYWGPDCLLLYNDAWRPIVGGKHPWSLGRPAREVWPEIWSEIGPEFESVFATGEGIFHRDELLAMHRFGYTEECFFDYTFNPIQGEGGAIDGILNIVSETTYRVLNDRRTQLLREVASKTGIAKTTEEACTLIAETLKSDPADIPFSLLYLIDPNQGYARLCGNTQFTGDDSVAPAVIDLDAADDPNGWPIARSVRTAQPQAVNDLVTRFGTLPGSPWPEAPQEAMVLPITTTGQAKVSGVLVAVASSRRKLDEHYRNFFNQITGQIATAIANAHSYEEERQRAEQLAELDRAKTVFFSNVSHEFRTPLTLMLGPIQEALQETQDTAQRDRLELIHRNALRLQKLVNTLLNVSRIEAGRMEAVYEPTNLALLTRDLAGVFRAVIERAGIRLRVDCPPLPEPIYIDREMWEKIVLNLLSNAFKFTFEGEIAVMLHSHDDHVELEVRDTGIGIPAEELPRIFERFHRVQGARGRTYEGSGIGLSLVQELVHLHGGTIGVSSIVDQGTSFIVSIPTGSAHLPSDRMNATRTLTSTATGATPYVTEVLRWLPEQDLELPLLDRGCENADPTLETAPLRQQPASLPSHLPSPKANILLADDNADMRDYVKRLLSQQYEVEAVRDGVEALAAIRQQLPDLVLTDVMMPGLDGFELLRELRTDPKTKELPIILLSARAGEESRLEGLEAGADDYLIKPFSARELLVRIETTLKLAQVRQEVTRYEQALRMEAEAAKEKVSQILESITDAFVAFDHQWRYTYVNEQAAKLLHKTPEELLGQQVWEVFPTPVEALSYQELHRALSEQVAVIFEDFNPILNLWFEVHAYPSREGLAVYFQDISGRKQAELMLVEQKRLLEAIASGNPLDECLSAICTTISTLNPRIRACFLLIDAQQHRFLRCITPNFGPSFGEGLQDVSLKDGWSGIYGQAMDSEQMTCADLANDDRWFPAWRDLWVAHGILAYHSTPVLDKDNRLLGLLILGFDEARLPTHWEYQLGDFGIQVASIVFERDRSTLALLESEHRYRTLFESIDEGFCICEMLFDENGKPTDYRFLKVNPAFENLTGLKQAVGKTARELVPNLEPFWTETYGRVVLTGEPVRFERESSAMNSWFDVNAFPVGEPQRHVAILFTNITDRKKVEQERERFLAVGSDLQVITSINGYFQWVSPTFERILGWTAEEMIARPWTEFVHPDDLSKSVSETNHLFSGNKTVAFENRYRHKDGSYRWFLWNAQPYPEEQVIYGAAVDITDRKQIEETLRQRETELRLVTDAVPALISFVDADQRYRFNNRGYEEWLGQSATELYGKHVREVLGETAYAAIRPYVEQVLAGQQVSFESRLSYQNGKARYVGATYVPRFNPQGVVEGFVALVHDISDRKQAEEALRESEARFRHLADGAPMLVWMSGTDKLCNYFNQSWLTFTGRTMEQELGNGWTEGLHSDDLQHCLDIYTTAFEARSCFEIEYRLRRFDGEYRWILDAGTPRFTPEGEFLGYIGSCFDIHDRKCAEQEREQLLAREQAARAAAERANRVKDEFLAIVSHELRSPLNPILGWSTLLQTHKLDSAKTALALSTIERNARLQAELIEDLLDLSRILRGKLSLNVVPTDLASTIQSAMETVRLAAEAKSIQIYTQLRPDIGLVSGDPSRLQQVVWNLLSNAIKFTPEGGQVEVRLERVGTHAQITVSDTGKGIHPDFLPYMFEYFRQENSATTRQFGGLGLGLAIVHHLVELHGGTVEAESPGEGLGATFRVKLPLIPTSASMSQDRPSSELTLDLTGIQVLVVDDDADTREFVAFLIEQYGANATAVASANEALVALSRFRPDVLLSDIGMPEVDGYMLIQQIRALPAEQGGQIPAIALTAYAGEIDYRQAMAVGFQRHIPKPVEPAKLVAAIISLVAQRK